jgi:hypothetical protein
MEAERIMTQKKGANMRKKPKDIIITSPMFV